MYARILVTLENSPADATILTHITELASRLDATVILIHVADGWAARNQHALKLKESEEMRDDRAYLAACCAKLASAGVNADAVLASGDPSTEIAAAAERENVDLIAMATHGHRFLNDLVRGSVANEVRHRSRVPVLLVRA
jgi:nucleotide-binding universal stress UspA family protein